MGEKSEYFTERNFGMKFYLFNDETTKKYSISL